MNMIVHKYKLYLSKAQGKILESQLDTCRWLYNHLLAKNIELYAEFKRKKDEGLLAEGEKFTFIYDMRSMLPELKKQFSKLKDVNSHVLQDVTGRLKRAFENFFRRCKKGGTPGFPRFKNKERYDSLTFDCMSFQHLTPSEKYLFVNLSKVGRVKLRLHRPLPEGYRCLNINVRRTKTGKWYASLCCEAPDVKNVLPKTGKKIGIDLGLTHYATDDQGNRTKNPRFLRAKQLELKRQQRALAKAKKGSAKRKKLKKQLAKTHEKIVNQRNDFQYKFTWQLLRQYDFIAVEDLNVKKMILRDCEKEKELTSKEKANKRGTRRSIGEAAWSGFTEKLARKAAEAGKTVSLVDPRNTSQRCSSCQRIVPKDIRQRWHSCECGLSLDRDHNAAVNILRLGWESLARSADA